MAETVNHPPHYGGDTPYEAIKVIEAWNLGFNLGNAVKYIARADLKGAAIEDLRKAAWYLDREIARRTPANLPLADWERELLEKDRTAAPCGCPCPIHPTDRDCACPCANHPDGTGS